MSDPHTPSENPYASPALEPDSSPEFVAPQGTKALSSERSPRQWKAIVRQRIRRGESASHVRADVVHQGLPQEQADQFIQEERASIRGGGLLACVVGALIAGLGVLATAGSYLSAQGPHGEYTIWFGAILFGAAFIIAGMYRLSRFQP